MILNFHANCFSTRIMMALLLLVISGILCPAVVVVDAMDVGDTIWYEQKNE